MRAHKLFVFTLIIGTLILAVGAIISVISSERQGYYCARVLRYAEDQQGDEIFRGVILQNCGDSIWPEKYVVLRKVSGDANFPQILPLKTTSPGLTASAGVFIHVPTEPGTYSATYRVEYPGHPFGEPITFTFTIP